jgi:hypothetical protein
MANETQKQIVAMLKKNIEELEERWPGYRKEMMSLAADIIQLQREFELKVSGSVVPKMTDKIDAFARSYDD